MMEPVQRAVDTIGPFRIVIMTLIAIGMAIIGFLANRILDNSDQLIRLTEQLKVNAEAHAQAQQQFRTTNDKIERLRDAITMFCLQKPPTNRGQLRP